MAFSVDAGRDTERLHHLDGLRGVAAVVVVVSHSANAGFLPGILGHGLGQMGVSLFYALSAFLLGHLYFRRPFTSVSVRNYAAARVARVLPLFYATLAIAAVIFLIFEIRLYEIGSTRAFLRNVFLIQGTSVLWSIPVELQYYCIFAGFWWLSAQRGWSLAALVATGLVVQAALAVTIWRLAPQIGSLNLIFWAHLFLAGLVLSQMPRPRFSARNPWLQSLLLAALVLIALPQLRREMGLPVAPNFADPLTIGVPLLLLVLALGRAAPLRFLDTAPLHWLGSVSFGLYLIHMPVIEAVRATGLQETAPLAGFAAILGVALFLSEAARRLIERPAQKALRARLELRRA